MLDVKKFISGVIVGVMLFAGASVFADSVSLIGQKVQGLYTIQKDGKKIGDAVIIKGTAYAPVRAVSNAAGTNLTVSGRNIIMKDEIIGPTRTEPVTLDEYKAELERINTEITQKQQNINYLETTAIPDYEQMAKEMADNGTLGKDAAAQAEKYKALLEQRKQELVDLQQKLTEINTKIAELEK